VTLQADEAKEGTLYDRTIVVRILRYALPYRNLFGIGFLTLLLLTLAQNLVPVFIKRAVDQFITAPNSAIDSSLRISGLTGICWYILSLGVMVFLFRTIKIYLTSWIGHRVVNDLRDEVFTKVLQLPIQYFDRNPVGRVMTRITSDLDAMQMFVKNGLIGVVANIMLLVGIMIFMLIIDTKFALLLFCTIPVLFAILTGINFMTRRMQRAVRGKQSALNARLQECITGITTVQLFNHEHQAREKFGKVNDELRSALVDAARWNSCYFPTIEGVRALAISVILLTGGYFAAIGEPRIGTLIAFLFYVRDFFRPLEELSDQSHLLQSAMASSERIFTLLDEPLIIENSPRAKTIENFRGEVAFDQVHFSYTENTPVLQDVSFNVAPGESLAIVGATGAGKTSIISLLNRLYDIDAGTIRVDGIDIREYDQESLRQRIGMVLQDPVIFSGTIASNISLNHPEITHDQIMEAAKYVNAHAFISKLPNGYNSETGERGANLSTGQKQLIALARALVQNPDILLVLDEATANVDTETEQLIQAALHRLMQNRTTIIIAHRLSTIKDVDRIIVMKQGRLIEEGSHEELIRQEGYYRTLYELLTHHPV